MPHRHVILAALTGLLLLSCQHNERVTLSLDYNDLSTLRYALGVALSGIVELPDSAFTCSTDLRTTLAGSRNGNDTVELLLSVGKTSITSACMDEAERLHLERQCEGVTLKLRPGEGTLEGAESDSLVQSLDNFGGWDLFRSLARVLPVLPEKPVTVGTSWERERPIPLETSLGPCTGWLYQTYTLDSIAISGATRQGFVSWNFSYRIDPPQSDSISLPDHFPLAGGGSGAAALDLSKRRLISAMVSFAVTANPEASVKISWQESARCELIE